jgi:protocatechuate 3,4-dioxygenase beta subunit
MSHSRRTFITGAAALAASQAAGCAAGDAPPAWDGRSAITKAELDGMAAAIVGGRLTCVRTPSAAEGPFYYTSSPARRDIAEGRGGLPLRLGIRIANATRPGESSCAGLAGAVVDVWQADADGLYSNVGADLQTVATIGETFMRGHQATDAEGYVEFDTVVPGWELVPSGGRNVIRTTHIHVKVFHEHQIATTQLYFPDEFLDELYASVDPYLSHRQMTAPGAGGWFDRIRNDQDEIFLADQSAPMPVERRGDVVVAEAVIGLVTLGSRGAPPLFR